MSVSVVIPAYNEEARIAGVIAGTERFADEIIVVDDASTDSTGDTARRLGARVVANRYKKGYVGAIKTGLREVRGEVVVTLDADGEHDPADIPRLVAPILRDEADLVLGTRETMGRVSEHLFNWLARLRVRVPDSCTGFRAMRRQLARELDLKGLCTCATLVLEADFRGARVVGVPVAILPVNKPRRPAWRHLLQVFFALAWLLKRRRPTRKGRPAAHSGLTG